MFSESNLLGLVDIVQKFQPILSLKRHVLNSDSIYECSRGSKDSLRSSILPSSSRACLRVMRVCDCATVHGLQISNLPVEHVAHGHDPLLGEGVESLICGVKEEIPVLVCIGDIRLKLTLLSFCGDTLVDN